MSEPEPASRAARIAAFVACCAIWGSTFLVIRIGNDTVPPIWAACLRLVLASALLWTGVAVRRQPVPRGAALTAAVQYGALQFGANFPLLYWAETVVPSGLSAVFYAFAPISLMLLARAFGLERLNAQKIAGAVTAGAGVLLLFSSEMRAHMPLWGLLAVFLSVLLSSLASTLLKRGPAQSPVPLNAVSCGVGAALCFLWSSLARESHALPSTGPAILPIVYLTLAGSLGAFLLWSWLVHHAALSKISYIAVLVPLVALTLGAVVRHERVAPLTLAGAAIVLAGVAIGLRAPVAARTAAKR